MSNYSVRMKAEPLRSLGFASISGTYAAIGSSFEHPERIMKITNLTDANLLISYDGVTNHEIMAAGGFLLLDISANAQKSEGTALPKRMTVYAKQESAAATSGTIYVSLYYGTDGSN